MPFKKPSLWQSLTGAPTQSYADAAHRRGDPVPAPYNSHRSPSRRHPSPGSSSSSTLTSSPLPSPVSPHFPVEGSSRARKSSTVSASTKGSSPNLGSQGWVHPSLRRQVAVESDQEDEDFDEEDEQRAPRRRNKTRAQRPVDDAEGELLPASPTSVKPSGAPNFDAVKHASEAARSYRQEEHGDGYSSNEESRGGSVAANEVQEGEARVAQISSSPIRAFKGRRNLDALGLQYSPPRDTTLRPQPLSRGSSSSGSSSRSSGRGGWNTSPHASPAPTQQPWFDHRAIIQEQPADVLPKAPVPNHDALAPASKDASQEDVEALRRRLAELTGQEVLLVAPTKNPTPPISSPALASAIEPASIPLPVDDAGSATPPPAHSPLDGPALVLQPPTPLGFDTAGISSSSSLDSSIASEPPTDGSSPDSPDLFSEHSFHPDRLTQTASGVILLGAVLSTPTSGASAPAPLAPLRIETNAASQLPEAARSREASPSKTFVSSPLKHSAPLDRDESALEDSDGDDERSSRSVSSLAPARPDSSPHRASSFGPHVGPSSSVSPALAHDRPSLSPARLAVHRLSMPTSSRPASIMSATSTTSRYSQGSYRETEVDAPPPMIIPAHVPFSLSPNSSRPSSIHSNSSSPRGTPRAGQTGFLPRPTSQLLDNFDGPYSFPYFPPAAPSSEYSGRVGTPSIASDSGTSRSQHASRRSIGGYLPGMLERNTEDKCDDDGDRRSLRSESIAPPRSSKAMSDVGSFSNYRLPQVMDGAARADTSTSISGGTGYTSLVLPSATYKPSKNPSRYSTLLSRDTLGLPQTSMGTIMVQSQLSASRSQSFSSPATALLLRPSISPTPSHLVPTPTISIAFTAHAPPPSKISSSTVLVRVWAVALDSYDALATRDASKGFVPGRSFVGKVLEWGDSVKGFTKGSLVFGLTSAWKPSGALSEFIVVDRRCLALAPQPREEDHLRDDERLTLEDIASLPLHGITAHRASGGITRGSRALVLLGGGVSSSPAGAGSSSDWNVGLLAAQELQARGVLVIVQVPEGWGGEAWIRDRLPRLKDACVRIGEAVEVVHQEHESSFDFVLDCEGGRRVYDVSRRILINGGQFTSTKGDTSAIPSATSPSSKSTSYASDSGSNPSTKTTTKNSFRSLRRSIIKKDSKQISYTVVPPSGSGPPVDAHGEDTRDILEWITSTQAYRPNPVDRVVPFERATEAFGVIEKGEAGRGVGRYRCEEDVWGVRLVN